jgi:Rod binding domain-containing protein
VREVAQELEAVFLAQVLAQLDPGLDSNERAPLHDIFNEEMAKVISRSGGAAVARRC